MTLTLKQKLAAATLSVAALGAGTPAEAACVAGNSGTTCTAQDQAGNAVGQANAQIGDIVVGAKERVLKGIIQVGGPAISSDATSDCMKTLAILGVYAAGNYDRDSDPAVACRDKKAMIQIAQTAIQSSDEPTKAVGMGLLSKLFAHVRDLNNEIIAKIGICLDQDKDLARHWARINNADEKYFCHSETMTRERTRLGAELAAQRKHELELAKAGKQDQHIEVTAPAAAACPTPVAPAVAPARPIIRRAPVVKSSPRCAP